MSTNSIMQNGINKDIVNVSMIFIDREEMSLTDKQEEEFWRNLKGPIENAMKEGCSLVEAKAFVLSFLDIKDINMNQPVNIGNYNETTHTTNVLLADGTIHTKEFLDYSSHSDYINHCASMPSDILKEVKRFFKNIYWEDNQQSNLIYIMEQKIKELMESRVSIISKLRISSLNADIALIRKSINE